MLLYRGWEDSSDKLRANSSSWWLRLGAAASPPVSLAPLGSGSPISDTALTHQCHAHTRSRRKQNASGTQERPQNLQTQSGH